MTSSPYAKEIMTCDQSMALLIMQKVRNVALEHDRKSGKGVTDTIDCSAVENNYGEAYQTERKTKTRFCDLSEESDESEERDEHHLTQSLEEGILQTLGGDGGDCYKDFYLKEVTAFVTGMGRPPEGARDFCLPYALLHDKLRAKEEHCKQISKADKDPSSCEIPDANGLCPGQKPVAEPQTTPEPEDGRQYNIKWSGGAVSM